MRKIIYVSPEIHTLIKTAAAKSGVSMQDFIEALILHEVKK
jgi:predicted HicB family RNase H-like nuclease